MEIVEVKTDKQLIEFIKFPFFLYKGVPQWVGQLISETKFILDTGRNPFWKHAERVLFMLIDEGKVAGRIAGIIDYNYIDFQKEQTGFFGFFECVNSIDFAKELFLAVENYLKSKNLKSVMGPMNPSTNTELGFLYKGYESMPVLMMPYNFEYYHDLVANCGFKKIKDLYAFELKKETLSYERVNKMIDKIKQRTKNVKVRQANIKKFDEEIKKMIEIYNSAWEKNWGFVPWTYEEFYSLCARMKGLLDPRLIYIAEYNGKPIGMTVGIPDYNPILKKLNGKISIIGIMKFLYYKRKLKSFRIPIVGVVKEFRGRGVELLMFYELMLNALKLGYEREECSWILEDNTPTIKVCEAMGAEMYKIYRIYGKDL